MKYCGSCTLCCKLVAVTELSKPCGKWCAYAVVNSGCVIYQERPPSCKAFQCAWLQTPDMPEDWKPNQLKAVITGMQDGTGLVMHIDPATPDIWHTNHKLAKVIAFFRSKFDVLLVWGDKQGKLERLPVTGRLVRK